LQFPKDFEMFDSVFHGIPSSAGGQSVSSGRASLGIDVAAGQIYYRHPETAAWIAISGGSGSGVPNNPASIITTTTNYTPALTDGTILANGAITVTLATNLTKGTTFRIKNIGTSLVTISSSVNIDGATTYSLNPYQYASMDVQFDGTQWWVL
jgi:hypothetical protein